jgi:phospholipid-translocating ATPase
MFEENFKFYDRTLLEDIQLKQREVFEFFRSIALCHTVMAEPLDNGKAFFAISVDFC